MECWIVKRMGTIKNKGRRADGDDVLYAGCVSPTCFLSPWEAVLVSDFERSRFTEQGGNTCGRIKGNSLGAKCAKMLVRHGLWVMKKSPRMQIQKKDAPHLWLLLDDAESWLVGQKNQKNFMDTKTSAISATEPALGDFWTQLTVLNHTKCI